MTVAHIFGVKLLLGKTARQRGMGYRKNALTRMYEHKGDAHFREHKFCVNIFIKSLSEDIRYFVGQP